MLAYTVLIVALAASGLAQTLPAGYRKVYLTSMANTKFVIVPKAPAKTGTTLVVSVFPP